MAKQIKKKIQKRTNVSPFHIYFDKTNYLLIALGSVLLLLGYYVMGSGEWDSSASLILSPIILIAAYVIIFPLSLFFKKKREEIKSE